MTAQTVGTTQIQQLIEAILLEYAISPGEAHLKDVHENEVTPHQIHDSFRLSPRQSQPLADLFRHAGSQFVVTMKANAIGSILEGARLADIVKQRAHRQFEGGLF